MQDELASADQPRPSAGIPIDPEYFALTVFGPKPDLSNETLYGPDFRGADKTLLPFAAYRGVTMSRMFVSNGKGVPDTELCVYTPEAVSKGPRPAIINIHGGGYVFGDLQWDHKLCNIIAKEVNVVVISPNYPLAPENPFPAAINTLYRVVQWVYDKADVLGIDAKNLAVQGSSAGGGLAASLALKVRDEGRYKLVFQLLIFPMLDDRTNLREQRPEVGKYIWNKVDNRFGWQSLLGNLPIGDPNVSLYAAASRATSLAGLPPAYITVGELDLFREEDVAYAQQLWKDGVSCELNVVPGVYHSFHNWAETQASKDFFSRIVAVLTRALYPRKVFLR